MAIYFLVNVIKMSGLSKALFPYWFWEYIVYTKELCKR